MQLFFLRMKIRYIEKLTESQAKWLDSFFSSYYDLVNSVIICLLLFGESILYSFSALVTSMVKWRTDYIEILLLLRTKFYYIITSWPCFALSKIMPLPSTFKLPRLGSWSLEIIASAFSPLLQKIGGKKRLQRKVFSCFRFNILVNCYCIIRLLKQTPNWNILLATKVWKLSKIMILWKRKLDIDIYF